jgi:hypothetical protein
MVEWSRTTSADQLLHKRYNDASASVDMLKRMIKEREARKLRIDHLQVLLRDAEAKKEAARAALDKAGVKDLHSRN